MKDVLSKTRIIISIPLVVISMGAWGMTDLKPGHYAVNADVPLLNYESKEILHVPYGSSKAEIPKFKMLGKKFDSLRRENEYFEELEHLRIFNMTDDGWFLLATGGPLDGHRWIYVFDDDGKLVWHVPHSEPWFNSIDLDDQGRVILFVVSKDRYEIDEQGYAELHPEDRPAYVAFYDSKGNREVLQTPQFKPEDAWFVAQGWHMRSPFHYAGQLYSGSDLRCDLKISVPSKRRCNKPILYQMYADGMGSLIWLGKKNDVRAFVRGQQDRPVAVYRLALSKGSVTSASFLGGEKQRGYFIGAWIDTGEYDAQGRFIEGGYTKILKLNYLGQVVGQFDITDARYVTGSFDYVDLKGRVFQCLTIGPAIREGGVTVVRWAPVVGK